MKPHACRGLATLMMCATMCGASAVHAQSFEPVVVQARRVQLFATATIQGQNGFSTTQSLNQFKERPPEAGFLGPFSVSDTLVFDVAAPDGTAAAHFETTQSQVSSFESEAMSFEGRFVASASTSGTPGPLSTGFVGTNGEQGGSGDGDFFGSEFEVHTPISAVLTLHADVAGGGEFVFNLDGPSPNGTVPIILVTASDSEPGGGVIVAHEVLLHLAPGLYNIEADLTGGVSLNAQGEFSAGFSLLAVTAPVPEVQSWALLAIGMPLLAAGVRRTRRRHA